jgi:hypothetical protein
MESGSLGMLIVGSISAIGLIQLIAWTVVVIRNPGLFPSTVGHCTACSTSREHTEQK